MQALQQLPDEPSKTRQRTCALLDGLIGSALEETEEDLRSINIGQEAEETGRLENCQTRLKPTTPYKRNSKLEFGRN